MAVTRSGCSTSNTGKRPRRSTSPSRAATSGAPRSRRPAMAASSSSGPRSATTTGTSSAAASIPRPARSRPSCASPNEPGTDSDAVLATAANGTVWMAWQAWTGGQADILLAPLDAAGKPGSPPVKISDTPANEWAPSIAADTSGRVHVAFDTYQAGNYDVLLRTREPDGTLSPADHRGRRRPDTRPGPAWPPIRADGSGSPTKSGRPTGARTPSTCSTARARASIAQSKVVVAFVDGDRVLHAPDPVEHAPDSLKTMNSYPRLAIDRAGRPWLAFRHRQEAIWGNNAVIVTGGVWIEPRHVALGLGLVGAAAARPAATACSTTARPWSSPPRARCSPSIATDGRLRREVEMNPQASLQVFQQPGDSAGRLQRRPGSLGARRRRPARGAPPDIRARGPGRRPTAASTPSETADLDRIRAYRVVAGGKTYRLLRGEFHRHTEISADGGSDGSLEDMWRYALDAAALDWIGNGDHDNGGGKEYTWWLIQKTTDLYTSAPKFMPMFTYERSVSYPHGHRNVMFDHRGVRTLPRLVGARRRDR